jgi:hypothetical protein
MIWPEISTSSMMESSEFIARWFVAACSRLFAECRKPYTLEGFSKLTRPAPGGLPDGFSIIRIELYGKAGIQVKMG